MPEPHRFDSVAAQLKSRQKGLLSRWCELVLSDSALPDQRLYFSDEELVDHLPALLLAMIERLEGAAPDNTAVRQRGAMHGHTRRVSGYSIEQLIWEFALFRKLLRQTMDELCSSESFDEFTRPRELLLEIADQSEIGSIHRYVYEADAERDEARKALEDSNEQKDRFLAVLSHELRNPLSALRAAIHILKESGFSEAQKRRALDIMDRQTEYERRLVDDLLDVNRISQGRIELKKERVDLRVPVERAVAVFFPAIESKAIKFQLMGAAREVPAIVDPIRVEQIVSNLLNNALKYTTFGGSIEIKLVAQGGTATISVSDNGAGVDPSVLPRIFELFAQGVDGPTDAGMGVGLWLAKTLAEMHGGSIRAASGGIGRGSQFFVELPCVNSVSQDASEAAKRVLLVEDDPDQRELLVIALSADGVEVVGAKDAGDAINLASEAPFDLCFLDLNLPDMSGYDLLHKLLELHGGHRPVTVALTGFGGAEDGVKVQSAGFDHHMVKPVDVALLRNLIFRP